MAFIRPFRAWRYNEAVVHDVNLRFSPLFDVVTPAQLAELYTLPDNSIHLSVPRSVEEAVSCLTRWKAEGIIAQDPLPGIYVYYQRFRLFGEKREFVRKGFVAMVRMGENGDIVEHEATIQSSVEERTRMLDKLAMNVAPTHGLYDDASFELEAIMDSCMEHPLNVHIDYQGVINQLGIIQNPVEIAQFVKVIGQGKVYLADGHHRLQSSRLLQEEYRQQGKLQSGDSMVNYHLMFLSNLRADDLRILPIHRGINLPNKIGDPGPLMGRISPWFSITEITLNKVPVYEDIRGRKNTMGMVIGQRHFRLQLREEVDPLRDIPLDLPVSVKSLDYTILHYFVFDQALGIPYEAQKGRREISYVKDYGTAMKQALADPHRIIFIMNELTMEQVMHVCEEGNIMPPKSTYFYPKVVCGLVFASIDDNENNSAFDAGFRFTETETSAG
jgi:uncharacterized protein (DUF1015 family)